MATEAHIFVFRDWDDDGRALYHALIIDVDSDPTTGEDIVHGHSGNHPGPETAIEVARRIAEDGDIEIDSVIRRDHDGY